MTPSVQACASLVENGVLDSWQLVSAIAHQERWGGDLMDVVTELGFVSHEVVLTEVARRFGVSYVDVSRVVVAPSVLRLVPERLMRWRRVLPLRIAAGAGRASLVVAMRNPGDVLVLDEVSFAASMAVSPVLAGARALDRAIERHLASPRRATLPAWGVDPPPAPEGPTCLVTVGEGLF